MWGENPSATQDPHCSGSSSGAATRRAARRGRSARTPLASRTCICRCGRAPTSPLALAMIASLFERAAPTWLPRAHAAASASSRQRAAEWSLARAATRPRRGQSGDGALIELYAGARARRRSARLGDRAQPQRRRRRRRRCSRSRRSPASSACGAAATRSRTARGGARRRARAIAAGAAPRTINMDQLRRCSPRCAAGGRGAVRLQLQPGRDRARPAGALAGPARARICSRRPRAGHDRHPPLGRRRLAGDRVPRARRRASGYGTFSAAAVTAGRRPRRRGAQQQPGVWRAHWRMGLGATR